MNVDYANQSTTFLIEIQIRIYSRVYTYVSKCLPMVPSGSVGWVFTMETQVLTVYARLHSLGYNLLFFSKQGSSAILLSIEI